MKKSRRASMVDRWRRMQEDAATIQVIRDNKDKYADLARREEESRLLSREAKIERRVAKAKLNNAEAKQDSQMADDIMAALEPEDNPAESISEAAKKGKK